MPTELTVKLRSYFRNTMHLIRSRRYEGLLQKMSTRLRGDAAYRMCEFRLRTVPFLVHPDLEPEFMCNLAIKYRTCVYSRLERVPCSELFIVERGVVAKRGRLGLSGACFGKDVILSNDNLRDMGDAIALTFVQTIALTQRDIFELLPDYPKAFYTVRKAALRMALIRALCKAAQIVKQSNLEKRGKSLIEIFDLAMCEANSLVEEKKKIDEARKSRTIPLSLTKSVGLLASFKKRKEEQQARITKVGKWGKIGGSLSRLLEAPHESNDSKIEFGSSVYEQKGVGKNLLESEQRPKTIEEETRDELRELAASIRSEHIRMLEGQGHLALRMSKLEETLIEFVSANAKLAVSATAKLAEGTPASSRLVRQKPRSRNGASRRHAMTPENAPAQSLPAGSQPATVTLSQRGASTASAPTASTSKAASAVTRGAAAANGSQLSVKEEERREVQDEAAQSSKSSVSKSSPQDLEV